MPRSARGSNERSKARAIVFRSGPYRSDRISSSFGPSLIFRNDLYACRQTLALGALGKARSDALLGNDLAHGLALGLPGRQVAPLGLSRAVVGEDDVVTAVTA